MVLFPFAALIVLMPVSRAQAETLEVPGTGACEGIVGVLAKVFDIENPGMHVLIPESIGSNGGIALVADDSSAIARVARRPTVKEGVLTY